MAERGRRESPGRPSAARGPLPGIAGLVRWWRGLSIQVRATFSVTLLVLLVAAATGWVLIRLQASTLREAISGGLDTLARVKAQEVGRFLEDSLAEARYIASTLPPEAVADRDPDAVETALRRAYELRGKFRNGFFLLGVDGILWADFPVSPGTRGRSFAFREYYQRTMSQETGVVSVPYRSARTGEPVLTFTSPLRGPDGKIAGLLGCSVKLRDPEALGGIEKTRIGSTGHLFLMDTGRLVILHPDETRVLQRDATPGVNSVLDRALEGFEGVGETGDAGGAALLLAVRRVPGTTWILGAQQALAEAYAPLRTSRHLLAGVLALAAILVLAIGLAGVRRFLRPLVLLAGAAREMGSRLDATGQIPGDDPGGGFLRTIRRAQRDEIGQLALSLEELHRGLRGALVTWEETFASIPDALLLLDGEGRILRANQGAAFLAEGTAGALPGRSVLDLFQGAAREVCGEAFRDSPGLTSPVEVADPSGGRILELTAAPVPGSGEREWRRLLRIRDVTAQRRAERALMESEEKFRTVVEHANEGIIVAQEGRIRYANPRIAEMVGLAPGDLAGRPFTDFIHPEDRDTVLQRHTRRLRGEESPTTTYRFRALTRDGRTLWLELRAALCLWEGRPATVSFLTDVTGRVRDEETLLRRMEFETMIASLSTEFITLEPGRMDAAVTGALVQVGRFTRADGVHLVLPARQGTPPPPTRCWQVGGSEESPPELAQGSWFTSLIANLEVVRIAHPATLPEEAAPERGWMERHGVGSLVAVPLVEGKTAIGWLAIHSHGSGGREWSEEEVALMRIVAEMLANAFVRRQKEEELIRSDRRFREMTEALPQPVFEVDLQGRFTFLNSSGLAILGLTPPDLEQGVRVTDILAPEDHALARENMARRIRGEAVPEVEYRGRGADGAYFPVMVHSAPIVRDGEPVGLRGIVVDLSERKRLEAERSKGQRLESLGFLAGGIAHDFNNLLTGILANISLARMYLGESDPAAARLVEAERGVEHSRNLTQQLLTFARGGAPVKGPVDLGRLLEETCSFVLRGSSVTCRHLLSADLPAVEADHGQIVQVFQNIMINAVQAMPDGGTVTVSARMESPRGEEGEPPPGGPFVRVDIADQGQGIPADVLPRIFDPYFTTKEGGTGLGLAVSHSVVRSHGGVIRVASRPGRGTTFSVFLPASSLPAAPAEGGSPVLAGGGGRVLLMDDDPAIRSVGEAVLRELGYEPETVTDGDRALEACRRALAEGRPFRAAILDLTIPGGRGGRETVGPLREMDPGLRLLVSSGYSTDPVLADHGRFGFHGRLIKPYRGLDLARELGAILAAGEGDGRR